MSKNQQALKTVIFGTLFLLLFNISNNANAQFFEIEDLAGGLEKIAPSIVMIDYDKANYATGVIVGTKGDSIYVLTAEHVVRDVDSCRVRYYSTRDDTSQKYYGIVKYKGERDTISLITVLGIPEGQQLVTIGKSKKLSNKSLVGTVGYPQGNPWAQALGFISRTHGHLIYLEAKLRTGNSGGPLFNKHGHMIGMVQAVELDAEEKASAVVLKSDVIKPVLDDWLEKLDADQSYERPFSMSLLAKAAIGVAGVSLSVWRLVDVSNRPGPLADPPSVPEVR